MNNTQNWVKLRLVGFKVLKISKTKIIDLLIVTPFGLPCPTNSVNSSTEMNVPGDEDSKFF
jgi:hypothetical protein